MTEKQIKVENINGALVAFYPIDGLKAVSIDIRVRAGSWYEGGENWGKAHLLEHMMFQGSKKFLNRDAMEVYKEEFGIWNNAWTSGSQIELALRMPAESAEQGFNLAKEMLFDLTIPEEELLRQKKVIGQEYEDRISRPGARFWEKRVEQLYGNGHLYTRDGIGKKECFEKVTKEELLEYMKEKIVPVNMCIAVAGKYEEKKIKEYLEKLLSGKGKEVVIKFEKIRPNGERLIHLEAGMTTATIEMAWETRGLDGLTLEEQVKTGLGSYLFGGSGRSLLFKIIREKMGLAYGARSGLERHNNVGWLVVDTSVKSENVDKVIEEIQKLILEFVNTPIDNETFERAKKYLLMQREMTFESTMGTASGLSSELFWERKIVSFDEYEKTMKKITEDEVRLAIKEIVENKKPIVGVMMSK